MIITSQFPLVLHPATFPQYGMSIFRLINQATAYFIYPNI